jgi:hypothetical protein
MPPSNLPLAGAHGCAGTRESYHQIDQEFASVSNVRFEENFLVEHTESAENLVYFGTTRELLPSPVARSASSELTVMDFPLTDQKVGLFVIQSG